MPVNECRDDEDHNINRIFDGKMPDVIHLAPTLRVSSPDEPVIIEDLTGYEIIKGDYSLVISNKECEENLILGERLGSMNLALLLDQHHSTMSKQYDQKSPRSFLSRETKHGDVTKAISFLGLDRSVSEITFTEEKELPIHLDVFAKVRMSL